MRSGTHRDVDRLAEVETWLYDLHATATVYPLDQTDKLPTSGIREMPQVGMASKISTYGSATFHPLSSLSREPWYLHLFPTAGVREP
jgi:hypothetical protein